MADSAAETSDHFEALLEHRRWLEQCRLSSSRDRDKAVLTLAGGSLAISVGFLERVVPLGGPMSSFVLAAAWGCEVTAMVLVLRSLHSSEAALDSELYRVDHMIRTGSDSDPGWPNPSAVKTDRLNKLASAVTVAGLILMLGHAAVNLYLFGSTGVAMSQNGPSSISQERHPGAGHVPAPPPPKPPAPQKK